MLVLRRKLGESIHIGSSITVKVTAIEGGRCKIAVDAPTEVKVLRGELEREGEGESEARDTTDTKGQTKK